MLKLNTNNFYNDLFNKEIVDYHNILLFYHFLLKRFYKNDSTNRFNIYYLKKYLCIPKK